MTRTSEKRHWFSTARRRTIAALLLPLIAGCAAQDRRDGAAEPSEDMKAQGRALFGGDRAASDPAPDEPAGTPPPFDPAPGRYDPPGRAAPSTPPTPVAAPATGWSILVGRVPGRDQAQAQRALDNIRSVGGLPDARLEAREDSFVILVGSYASPQDPAAARELQRVRATHVSRRPIYSTAYLIPPTGETMRGTNPEWDLRTVRDRFGSAAVYTLQIGVYTRLDGRMPSQSDVAEFRKAAEAAVAELRAEGEQAFYFHGPTSSMVTVGVFGEDDHDASVAPAIESTRLREARERHPNNLVNGQGFNETIRTDSGRTVRRLQKSALVMIPK